ncbi:hypothetical protein GIB67_035664 [Kingdonia uniflora]|uniref:Pentatricopeptide repeat-containing protein n=1 Tax=Kingdonia uniflora TaxID=39325 RepID=A0A7J7KVB3_9MAGN|nr:hypothetical protein GIB67_035664 [Kingdonia uniflora]
MASVGLYKALVDLRQAKDEKGISHAGFHGLGGKALSLFQIMRESGVKPDAVTFVAILLACRYAGMIDQDMLGRAGRVIEAYEFVKNLGNVAGIWGSLLGACRIHGELELGEVVAKKLFTLNEGECGRVWMECGKAWGTRG